MRFAVISSVIGNIDAIKQCINSWLPLPDGWDLYIYKSKLTYIDSTADYLEDIKNKHNVTVIEDGRHLSHPDAISLLLNSIKDKGYDWILHLDSDAKLLDRSFFSWAEKTIPSQKHVVWGKPHERFSSKIDLEKGNLLYLPRAHPWLLLINAKFLYDNDINFDDMKIHGKIIRGKLPKTKNGDRKMKMGERIIIFGDTAWQLYVEASRKNLFGKIPDSALKMWNHLNNKSVLWFKENEKEINIAMKQGEAVFDETPQKASMAVCIVHFNWAGYYTPSRNLQRFIRQMADRKIPLYGVELSLNGKFETAGMKNWTHINVSKENVCFQKEACINLLEKIIPAQYTNIAWIDHDLQFCNLDWYDDAIYALGKYKAVQLFSRHVSTDKYGKREDIQPSLIKSFITAKAESKSSIVTRRVGMPGCAWAARRELWKNGGLYPFSFLGGGDTMFIYTILEGMKSERSIRESGIKNNEMFEPYLKWKDGIRAYISENEISYILGDIVHEWHGDSISRKYNSRYELVDGIDYSKTLSLDENGLVKILNVSDEIYEKIINYFKDRREDG